MEDDATVASLMVTVLEEEGVDYLVARSTREADLALATVAVRALVVDLTLPGTDGLTWLEQIRATDPELAGRSVLSTGAVLSAADEQRLERCGSRLLYKPFPLTEFRAVVRDILHAGGSGRTAAGGEERPAPPGRDDPDPPRDEV